MLSSETTLNKIEKVFLKIQVIEELERKAKTEIFRSMYREMLSERRAEVHRLLFELCGQRVH